jgi:catechol 2,3-dioxygenase-like lactoylglutathione lyase family enzyme
MLKNHNAIATVAVKDIDAARRFYTDTLDLEALPLNEPGVLSFKSGNSLFFVYQSEFAGTNKASAATWVVGDEINSIVETLITKGVAFERYEFPNVVHDGDIHVMGETRAAWLKDPDGNILALVNR